MADYAISNVPRRVVYAASGTGPYAFTFEILSQTDIAVYKASTLLTLTTDYTVTINANGTGSVTLVATAGTDNITIVGAKNIQRTTDFTTGGDLFANTLNDELDNQTIFIQQVAETAERGLKAPVTDPTDIAMTLPAKASRANKYLGFNGDGNPVAVSGTNVSPGTMGDQNSNNVAITGGTITGITDLAIADGGTGASTAAAAPFALKGSNSDITALSGLTTALSIGQGGTGATSLSAGNVLLGNGTSSIQAVAPGTSGNVLTSNGSTWTSAAISGGVTSLNGQTGNITNTTFGNIGNTATLLLFSTSTFKTNDTVSGSILYYPTTATYQASVGLITSQFSSTSVYTSVGSNVGSENATPTQKVLGNTGHVAPLGCSTVSGTWRIVSLTGRGDSSYDLCTNTTTVLYGQVMVVRVS